MRRLALGLVLVSLLLQTSCVDLSAIRKFTEVSSEAGKHFPGLANDFYRSCMQQRYYQAVAQNQFDAQAIESFTRALIDPDDPEIRPGPPTIAITKCQPFRADQENLIKANKVLVSYLQTMGELAADDLTSYDKSLDGLNKSFVSSKFLNQDTANAVIKLAGVVINVVTEGYRRRQLAKVIGEYNRDVRTLAFGLGRAVNLYLVQLNNERDQMRSYYKKSILSYADFANFQVRPRTASGGQPVVARNPLPIVAVKQQWDAEEAKLQAKLDAANAYKQILYNIADGHQSLYRNRDRLNAKDVIQAALAYAKTAESLVADFKKAF